MKISSLLTLISVVLLLPLGSSSQIKQKTKLTRDICYEAISRGDMDRCDYHIFDEAEGKLKHTYEKLHSGLEESQQSDLEHSQQEWLKFRDTNCVLATDFVYRQCMTRMTRERVDELQNFHSRFMERH